MSVYADIDYRREHIPPVSLIFILKSLFLVKVDGNKFQKIFFKISLLTEILAKKVKKIPKFCKKIDFLRFDCFFSIFRQQVNQKPQNLVLFYFILSPSELI